jgi:hypothetical protein
MFERLAWAEDADPCRMESFSAAFSTGLNVGRVLLTNEICRFSLIFCYQALVCSVLSHNAAQPSLSSFSSLLLRPTGRRFSWIQLQRGPDPGL